MTPPTFEKDYIKDFGGVQNLLQILPPRDAA